MRRDKHKLGKEPTKHSQSLQKKAKETKEQRRMLKKQTKILKGGTMDVESTGELHAPEKTPEEKEADRLARKKANAHKVAVYKKMNYSLTSNKGHRAVR
jgi:peptidoglycan hydrolase CwlO-like protein